MTLEEHDALLKREGRYEAIESARLEKEQARQRKAAEWRRAEAPLSEVLRGVGLDVESAWDLVNTAAPYPEALPILPGVCRDPLVQGR
jgi:hypothetical protein